MVKLRSTLITVLVMCAVLIINANDNIEENDQDQELVGDSEKPGNTNSNNEPLAENKTSEASPVIEQHQEETGTRYNCTPAIRNNTAQLIVVNSTEMPAFVKSLKSYVIMESMFDLSGQHQETQNQTQQQQQQPSPNQTTVDQTPAGLANNQCSVIIFYYRWCRFSAAAAPQFNALGRLLPQIYVMAIDAYYHYGVTVRFGVSGVPSVYFLYNGRAVAKYNRTDITVDGLVDFVRSLTILELPPPGDPAINVTDGDLAGPLTLDPEKRADRLLIYCWIFCLVIFVYHFLRSTLYLRIKDHVRAMWNEAAVAAARHEHVD